MVRNTVTAAALVFGSALVLGPAPATAQPQGYFGPGRDGDYQPPAYDRDRVGPDRGARQGRADSARSARVDGGLYGGPLYDREPYGYGYSGSGADAMRPDRSEMERGAARAQFERGYRMGREDERYRLRAQAAHDFALSGPARGDGADRAGGLTDDAQGRIVLPLERSLQQQQAMRDLRESLQEARTAVQQGDRARAEAALGQADRLLRLAGPGVGGDRLAAALMNRAEQALEQGNQEAAQRALQQARQAVRDQRPGQQQAQQRSANPGGEGGSDAGAGAGGQAPR